MTASAYTTPRLEAPIDLDLSRNEGRGQAGLLDSVMSKDELIRRYPDTSALQKRLADLHGLSPDRVLVTAGGDDALFRCFLARVGQGRSALATRPSFEMLGVYARQVGGILNQVEWWGGPFPLAQVSEAGDDAGVIFVVSPNNPTGSTITPAELEALSRSQPSVVLDAAYVEFSDDDLTPLALELDNVLVVRTLSKAYGLAGLRVGYLLGPADLVGEVSAYGNPYSVSSLSAAIALERLNMAPAETTEFIDAVRSERDELARFLANMGIHTLPSQANFVLARVGDAASVAGACANRGVAIRWFPTSPELLEWVRITVPGDRLAMERLIRTLEEALA
jgi:histidinol-phosphate aminotransferase